MIVLYSSFKGSLRGVNFIIIRPDNKILVQKRCPNAHTNPNRYCFPGGAIEKGEKPLIAVEREAYEETGVFFHKFTYLCDIEYELKGVIYVNRVFLCRVPFFPYIFSKEGKMFWKTIKEIDKIDLALGENVILPILKEVI